MSGHIYHPRSDHPIGDDPTNPFFFDGCARCEQHVKDMGIHLDPLRFRAFWEKMIAVEFQDGEYASCLDARLGRNLYRIALALSRASGIPAEGILPVLRGDPVRALTGHHSVVVEPLSEAGSIRSLTLVSDDPLDVDEQVAVDLARMAASRLQDET